MHAPSLPSTLPRSVAALHRTRRILTIGALDLDLDLQQASIGGALIPLSISEFTVLHLLASRPGVPMSKEVIAEALRADGAPVDLRMIDVYVSRARRKLDAAGIGGLIASIWGRGYAVIHEREDAACRPATQGGHDPVLVAA